MKEQTTRKKYTALLTSDLPPADHLRDVTFEYIPEGFTETVRNEVNIDRYVAFNDASCDYTIWFEQLEIAKDWFFENTIDIEDAEVTDIFIHGESAIQVVKNNYTHIYWSESTYLLEVHGNVSTEELLKFADGIALNNE